MNKKYFGHHFEHILQYRCDMIIVGYDGIAEMALLR